MTKALPARSRRPRRQPAGDGSGDPADGLSSNQPGGGHSTLAQGTATSQCHSSPLLLLLLVGATIGIRNAETGPVVAGLCTRSAPCAQQTVRHNHRHPQRRNRPRSCGPLYPLGAMPIAPFPNGVAETHPVRLVPLGCFQLADSMRSVSTLPTDATIRYAGPPAPNDRPLATRRNGYFLRWSGIHETRLFPHGWTSSRKGRG